jgi:carboxyl-terminal processing protease
VYGGGGISPDEKYPSPVYNVFQRRLAPYYSYLFFRFGNVYFNGAKPAIADGWQPDNATLERFRDFLKTQKVTFTDEEFDANKEWVREQIRWEFYFRTSDKPAADRARWMDDPEIRKALESMPRAQSLLEQVQRVLAMRASKG